MGWAHHFLPDETELAEHYPTRAEKAADGAVHAIGLLLAAIGGAALFIRTLTIGHAAAAGAAAAYAVCLVAMLTASAIYNLTRPSKARRVLRRLDEAAIFVMIAGSYTPFTITQFPDPWAFWITAAVWALAAVGAFGKLFVALSDLFWSLVYIGFGWLSVVIVLPMAQSLTPFAIGLLAAGGLVYTSGVAIYLKHSIRFRRAIWHTFVVVGAALHFGAIWATTGASAV
jgi:hemolysin III